jgi:hypothetical protein
MLLIVFLFLQLIVEDQQLPEGLKNLMQKEKKSKFKHTLAVIWASGTWWPGCFWNVRMIGRSRRSGIL